VRSDWFEAIAGEFDLIVSNPPYIRSMDIAGLDADVRDHDPRLPSMAARTVWPPIAFWPNRRPPTGPGQGALAVEIGHDQKQDVTILFEDLGFRRIGERKDYSGTIGHFFL
jgi:release factor glutamine methyltransferase